MLTPLRQRSLLHECDLDFRWPAPARIDPIHPRQRFKLVPEIGEIRCKETGSDARCQPRLNGLNVDVLGVTSNRELLYLLTAQTAAALIQAGAHQHQARYQQASVHPTPQLGNRRGDFTHRLARPGTSDGLMISLRHDAPPDYSHRFRSASRAGSAPRPLQREAPDCERSYPGSY